MIEFINYVVRRHHQHQQDRIQPHPSLKLRAFCGSPALGPLPTLKTPSIGDLSTNEVQPRLVHTASRPAHGHFKHPVSLHPVSEYF